jgi:RNA:NAD 2'-phosphotransferase (TPT1/KptA family)
MAKTHLSIKKTDSHNPKNEALKSGLRDESRLHVHLPATLKTKLKVKAANEGKSITDIVIELLETHL